MGEIKHLQEPLIRWIRRTWNEKHVIVIKSTLIGRRGWPDLMLFTGGCVLTEIPSPTRGVLFIELKLPGKKLTKLQKRTHQQLIALGFDVDVHTDLEDAKLAITEYMAWHK